MGGLDAFDARDPVVDRDDQRRAALRRQRDDARSQSVTELKAIRHQEIDVRKLRASASRGRAARCPWLRPHRSLRPPAPGPIPGGPPGSRPHARLLRACRPAAAARATDPVPPHGDSAAAVHALEHRVQIAHGLEPARLRTPPDFSCQGGFPREATPRRRRTPTKAGFCARTSGRPRARQMERYRRPREISIRCRRPAFRSSSARTQPALLGLPPRRRPGPGGNYHDTRPRAGGRPRGAGCGRARIGRRRVLQRRGSENSASSPAVQPPRRGALLHRLHHRPRAIGTADRHARALAARRDSPDGRTATSRSRS